MWSSVPANATCKAPESGLIKTVFKLQSFTSVIILAGKIVDCGFDCRVFAIFSCSPPVATAHLRGSRAGHRVNCGHATWRLFY